MIHVICAYISEDRKGNGELQRTEPGYDIKDTENKEWIPTRFQKGWN